MSYTAPISVSVRMRKSHDLRIPLLHQPIEAYQ
jgi:hypothetical protein